MTHSKLGRYYLVRGCKYLANVLYPLVGRTEHHVKNSRDFVKEIRIELDEELCSYDLSALSISVPVDKALNVIREKLEDTSCSR